MKYIQCSSLFYQKAGVTFSSIANINPGALAIESGNNFDNMAQIENEPEFKGYRLHEYADQI